MPSFSPAPRATRPFSDLSSRLKRGRICEMLQQRSFRVAYQPIFAMADDRLVGVEALTRVQVRPYRSPDAWFSEAYEVGLGPDLEIETLTTALGGLDLFPAHMFLALNASPDILLDQRFSPLLEGIDARRLVLELTEHTAVDDYRLLMTALRPLRDRGARLAIDDVGAGYANMQHILSLRPDILKIDASLTNNIHVCPSRAALLAGLVQFARTFDTRIVAEGIEVEPQRDCLRELGVDYGQGYLLGRPLLLKRAR